MSGGTTDQLSEGLRVPLYVYRETAGKGIITIFVVEDSHGGSWFRDSELIQSCKSVCVTQDELPRWSSINHPFSHHGKT
jgi:hypothetical protein